MNMSSSRRSSPQWPTRVAWVAASLATLGGVVADREPDVVLRTSCGAFVVMFILGRVLLVIWQLLADGPGAT